MSKILIHLKVPAASQEFDVFVPTNMLVQEITYLLGQAVEKMTNGVYCSSGHELLCRPSQGYLLQHGYRLEAYSILRGEELILL